MNSGPISYVIALYIRLSTEDSKVGSFSIENQKNALHRYVDTMEGVKNVEVLEFVDNGYSGTNFERPAVQELLDQIREGKINCIIVKDFTRFGRNSIEVGYFMEMVFPLYGVRFISINDNFDSDTLHGDTGGINVAFKYLVSEFYSRDLSIKYKSAKYVKFRRGEYQSKLCPYGYRKGANGRMEPNEETAPNVQLIFELAWEGYGPGEIGRELFMRGVCTPGEYKTAHGIAGHDVSRCNGVWPTSTIIKILDDERYTGTYVIGKKTVVEVGSNHVRQKDREKWYIIPDHHPAIVDQETFDAAQAKLTRFKLPNKKAHEYPLKGKVFCGCCRHALSRTSNKTSYYHCRHSVGVEGMSCNGMKVLVTELEQAIFETLKGQIEQLICPDGILDSAAASIERASEYEQQLSDLQGQKMRLYEQYVSKVLDADRYRQEKAAVDALILRTKNIYAAVIAQAKKEQAQHEEQVQRNQIVRELSAADGLTQGLANLLIDKVYVYPDRQIEISYKVKDIFSDVI